MSKKVPEKKAPAKKDDGKERARAPRKPPLERAARLAIRVGRNVEALEKNVAAWHGDVTDDQRDQIDGLKEELPSLVQLAASVSAALTVLKQLGFSPRGASPGRKPLSAGAHVVLKDKRYAREIHGPNDFEVVAVREHLVEIRARGNLKASSHGVPRSWLVAVDAEGTESEEAD